MNTKLIVVWTLAQRLLFSRSSLTFSRFSLMCLRFGLIFEINFDKSYISGMLCLLAPRVHHIHVEVCLISESTFNVVDWFLMRSCILIYTLHMNISQSTRWQNKFLLVIISVWCICKIIIIKVESFPAKRVSESNFNHTQSFSSWSTRSW